jgi:hypothetical protein
VAIKLNVVDGVGVGRSSIGVSRIVIDGCDLLPSPSGSDVATIICDPHSSLPRDGTTSSTTDREWLGLVERKVGGGTKQPDQR